MSCGDGLDRLCASCNRDLRRERMCPLCLAPLQRRRDGRRITYVHPTSPTCLVAYSAPWFYHGHDDPYLILETPA